MNATNVQCGAKALVAVGGPANPAQYKTGIEKGLRLSGTVSQSLSNYDLLDWHSTTWRREKRRRKRTGVCMSPFITSGLPSVFRISASSYLALQCYSSVGHSIFLLL